MASRKHLNQFIQTMYAAIPPHKKTRVQPTTTYNHALMMVSFTYQLLWRVSSWGPETTHSFDCFQYPVQCSHLIAPRHCLQDVCTGLVASRKHLNQFMQTVYAAIPPTRRHSTSHNNISPCSNDGVIYSPVAMKSFLLTAGGNALRLRSTHRAVSALGSAFTRVGATISSATYMYGTGGKCETSESIHADSVRSHPHPYKKTRVQPTTTYNHALLMVSWTH